MFLASKKHFLRRAVSGRIAFGALLAAALAGAVPPLFALAVSEQYAWDGFLNYRPLAAVAVAGEPKTILIAFFGDMMFDRNVRAMWAKRGGDYPFAAIGAVDPLFREPDLVVGNLEGAISPRLPPVKTIDFAFDPAVADLLLKYGVDAVNLANNHALDQGRAGAVSTKAELKKVGIGYFGDEVVDSGFVWQTSVRGRKIAFLGFNLTDNAFDEKAAETAVRAAAQANDLAIVEVHWGDEYKPLPNKKQKELGRKFVDWGAAAVIGTHPHVIEGMELWQGKPIFWSLGNFIFDQDWSVETKQGLAVSLEFENSATTARLYPVRIDRGQPTAATGTIRSELLDEFARRSTLSDDLRTQARDGIINIRQGD